MRGLFRLAGIPQIRETELVQARAVRLDQFRVSLAFPGKDALDDFPIGDGLPPLDAKPASEGQYIPGERVDGGKGLKY
jgi:hypothetical protein